MTRLSYYTLTSLQEEPPATPVILKYFISHLTHSENDSHFIVIADFGGATALLKG